MTENQLEHETLTWLQDVGYAHRYGPDIAFDGSSPERADYRQVILPGALSSILVGLRFSLGLMWVILIVAETISAQAGIGYLTMNAREFLQTDIVLVGILLYALLGKLADLFAKVLERYWLRWHPGYQPE